MNLSPVPKLSALKCKQDHVPMLEREIWVCKQELRAPDDSIHTGRKELALALVPAVEKNNP